MAKVRITLAEEQLKEVVTALYQVGNPLGDRFAKLVDAVEASKTAKMEATVEDEVRKTNADELVQRYKDAQVAAERKRKRNLEEILSIFGNAYR